MCNVPITMSSSRSSVHLDFSFSVSRSPNRLSRMALAMGSIMAVVAVLLSHMDKKDEVSIIPSMSLGKNTQPLILNGIISVDLKLLRKGNKLAIIYIFLYLFYK